MKWLKFVRTFKEGAVNFYRNGSLTFVTVTVLSVSLYAISAVFMYSYIANIALIEAQDKVNINVYFNSSLEEDRINEIKDEISNYEEVKYVKYVSKENAFEELKAYAETEEIIKKALDVLDGENPLNPFLVVGAKDGNQYQGIIAKIDSSIFAEDVYDINFKNNEKEIEAVSSMIAIAKKTGAIMGGVFIFIGILITFNTVKLTIYSHKQEFEVMRLVGASNIYIRMPFVFEGIFYGFASGLIVILLLFGTSYFISPLTDGIISQGSALKIFFNNFLIIFAGVFGIGILLGAISSFIAIRKYLKI